MIVYEHRPKTPLVSYLLGILCLIPLIGAFVGLALLLVALLYYKDKWLAMIGAFGILFTVAIYSAMFLFFFKSGLPRKAQVSASQLYLNTLVQTIEYYKLEHGQYPDSLQQLASKEKFVMIYDPLRFTTNRKKKGEVFNYERIGSKYLLFSSGVDGVPNTPDDLHPKVIMSDSSKIGWTMHK